MRLKPAKKTGNVELEFYPDAEPRIATAFLNAWRNVAPVRFKKILATTDFSELSTEAIEYAVAMAEEFRSSLALIYVVQPSLSVSAMENVVVARGDAELIRLEKKRLSNLAKGFSRKERKVKTVVRYGKPFREIATEAAQQKVDLIVIGGHGHTGLKRVLLGSTAEWVVRHSPCPVLMVPAIIANRITGKRWSSRIKKIMVPVDFSETSASALPYAAELAARFRAEVILIHVTEPPLASRDFTYIPLEETNRAAEEMLSYIQRETFSDNIQTRAVIRSGTPFDEITRAAARERADLIVLTTRGWTGLKHVLLGSTAERIVRHASCPVLVARDKETTK